VTATSTAPAARPATSAAEPAVGPVIARHAFGLLWKQALVVGVTFGGTAASSALAYASTYPTQAARSQAAAGLRGNGGFSMLFGQVDAIGSVGGYTAYKGYVFLTTVGAIWAALAVTRLLRGEEDAGRWAVLVAGRTTPGRATRATLAGVAAAISLSVVLAVALVAVTARKPELGFGATDAAWFGVSLALPTATFAALAAVTAQLARSRRLASGLALGGFALAFVVRMVADSGPGSHWLLWATPLGWAELVKPFTANDAWPVVPAVAVTVGLGITAIALARRRDVGGGLLATDDTTAERPFGLGSLFGLSVRLERTALAVWALGMAATSFVFGIVAKAVVHGLIDSADADRALRKLGASGSGVDQYFGIVFLLVGAVLALVPAGQVAAARAEEATGRLAYVLTGPTGRTRWLAGRLAIAASAIVATGVVAGGAAWAGAASQGVHARFGTTVLAGLNVVPAALVALALGALVLAVAPRAAPTAVYVVVGWSFLVDLLSSLATALHPLARTSLFHYVSLVPAVDPDWTALAVLTALAVALSAAALAIFVRRDLQAG